MMEEDILILREEAIGSDKLLLTYTNYLYDILILSDDVEHLKTIKEKLNDDGFKPTLLRKTVFDSPLLIVATASTDKDAREIFNQIKRNLKEERK